MPGGGGVGTGVWGDTLRPSREVGGGWEPTCLPPPPANP